MAARLHLTTVLATALGLAAGPAECVAQAGSRPWEWSLRAAIEEVRRSPFHAGRLQVGAGEARLGRQWIDGAPVFLPPQADERAIGPGTVGLTYAAAGIGYLIGTIILLNCWFSTSDIPGCPFVAPIVPLALVPLPGVLMGAGPGRALGSSVLGLGAGAAACVAAVALTGNFYVAMAASATVHATVVTARLR